MTSTTLSMTRNRAMSRNNSQNAESIVTALAGLVAAWRERRESRLILCRLDDHMLSDIGLSRADAEVEIAKPFWRA